MSLSVCLGFQAVNMRLIRMASALRGTLTNGNAPLISPVKTHMHTAVTACLRKGEPTALLSSVTLFL